MNERQIEEMLKYVSSIRVSLLLIQGAVVGLFVIKLVELCKRLP